MDIYMLTTKDNPYSPITDYDEWLAWDMLNYNTNALLARVVHSSPDLSEPDQLLAIQEGIDEIVRENVSGMHVKVLMSSGQSVVDDSNEDDTTEDQAA